METGVFRKPDVRVSRTRSAIREALASLMLENSLSNITVLAVCEKANLNRGTFYSHYKDINDLYESIKNQTLEDFYSIFSYHSNDILVTEPKQVMGEILDFVEKNFSIFKALLGENGDFEFVEKIKSYLAHRFFNDWLPYIGLVDGSDAELLYYFCLSGMIGVVSMWIKDSMKKSKQEIVDTVYNVCSCGLRYFEKKTYDIS